MIIVRFITFEYNRKTQETEIVDTFDIPLTYTADGKFTAELQRAFDKMLKQRAECSAGKTDIFIEAQSYYKE